MTHSARRVLTTLATVVEASCSRAAKVSFPVSFNDVQRDARTVAGSTPSLAGYADSPVRTHTRRLGKRVADSSRS